MTAHDRPPASPSLSADTQPERPGLRHLSQGRLRASISGVAWSFLGVTTTTLIGIVVYVVTSRALAPSDFGLIAFGSSIVLLASIVLPSGFGTALIQREEVTEGHLQSVFWLCAAIGCAVYVGLVLGAGWIAQLTNTSEVALVLAPLGIRLLSDSLSIVPAALLFRRMQFRAFAIRSMIANALGGTICLIMVWLGAGFWALVAAPVIGSVVNLIVVWSSAGWRPRWEFNFGCIRELMTFGLSSTGTRIVNEVRIDQFLIGMVAGPNVLGLYFFARRLFSLLIDLTVGIFSPVANVLFASTQSEPEKARQAFQLGGFVAASVGLPLLAAMMVMADTAITLVFGDHWNDAIFAVQTLMASGLLAVLGIVQGGLINGRGYAGWWLAYQFALQVAAVPLIVLLYPLYGFNGMMVGMASVIILLWPLSLHKALTLLDLSLQDYLVNLAGPVLATALMSVAIVALPLLAPELSGLARFGAEFAIGSVVYLVSLVIISRRHLEVLLEALRGRQKAPG